MRNTDRTADLSRLDRLIGRLRAPDGCPWDRKQTMSDLRAYLLEEAHELADAIDRNHPADLREELGDLLFQTAFVGRLASESGLFELADAIDHVEAKMIERHPHVFGDEVLEDSAAVEAAWERRKLSREKSERSALDGVPATLPSLLQSYRVGQKAAGLGFDWPELGPVLEKVREELAEVEEHIPPQDSTARQAVEEEVGDLLLAVSHLARHLDIDPEAALAQANRKFARRFRSMETTAAERGLKLETLDADAWDGLWEESKRRERRTGAPD